MHDKRTVKLHTRQRLLEDFFVVDAVEVSYEREDGSLSGPVRLLCLERGDAVAAVLVDPVARRAVLVRQFRYPTLGRHRGWIEELVAGMVDEGESPEQAVRREILEETGLAVDRLERLYDFYVSPGGSTERVHLFYAETDLETRHGPGGGVATESEDIEVLEIPFESLWPRLDAGEFHDAKTLVGLQWLRTKV